MVKKKIWICGMLFALCLTAGCGGEERIKTAEERAVELQGRAKEVVGDINEENSQLNQNIDNMEDTQE